METINVIIEETSDFGFGKISEEIPKEILPSQPKDVQEEVNQGPDSPGTLSVVEVLVYIPTSLESISHEKKEPSLRIKLNHPLEVIVGNMNELTLRKCTVDKLTVHLLGKSFDSSLYKSMIGSLFYLTAS